MAVKDKGAHPGRFARRLFVWFAVATALPVLLLSVIAYFQVHRQLEDDAYRQLHRVAKTVGMYLYAHLAELDSGLSTLGPVADKVRGIDGVQAFVILDDRLRALLPEDEGTDGALLTVLPPELGERRVLMVPAAWREDYGLHYGVILAPDVLQAPAELLPGDLVYCVADSHDELVLCEGALPPGLLQRVASQRGSQSSGTLGWETGGQAGLAAYWSVFMRGRFSARDWVITVSRDEQDVYASMALFHTLLPQILLLSLVLAMLLAVIQLRQRLKPLGQVVEATRRFASGDFSARVSGGSHDELAQLADAFNHMAARTDLQFKRLASLAELDRLILSSFEEEKIVTITLERIRQLVGCRQVAFVAPPREGGQVRIISKRENGEMDQLQVPAESRFGDWFGELAGPVSVTPEEQRSWPLAAGSDGPTLFPVCRQGRCFGAVLVDWVSAEQQLEFIGVLNEFSDRLAVALSNAAWEGELFRQAHYDDLTGLANRTLLTDRLEQALLRADRNGTRSALLFLDLDGFKTVNDTLGHQTGDAFLVAVARRLREAASCAESVVRFGGDEFVILITDIPADTDLVADLAANADRLIGVLAQPVELAGHRLTLGASIGIAVYPGDGDNASELLRNADAAMYHAKAAGRGHAEFYAQEMNEHALERLALLQDLTEALQHKQGLFLEFQPQLCARTGELTGVEALSRWRHPTRGLVSPAVFVPLMEESGLIVPFGEWVLREACRNTRALLDQGVRIPRLGVNVAPNQFWTPGFLEMVLGILDETGLPADVLELEVTEGTMMRDPELGKSVLMDLHAAGIRLSVDDFGTGYSSLSYLQWLPLDTLKIDRSFVKVLDDGDASVAIAAAIITLGKRLGLNIIAEGVDSPDQVAVLRELDCDEFQGFLFSRPLGMQALTEWYLARTAA